MHETYLPVRRDSDLTKVLNSMSHDKDMTITQLAECNFFFLQKIAAGKLVTLADLAAVHRKYPQALLNGRPEDPQTLASVLQYVGDRLPTKVFRPGLQLRIHSELDKTMAVPQVHEYGTALEHYRKKTPARSRWTLVDSTNDQHPIVDFHLRDTVPQEPTDGLELLSWLGSLEQVRETAQKFVHSGIDCTPLIRALTQVLKHHIEAEIEMLNKRLAFETLPAEGGQHSAQFVMAATERITRLEQRMGEVEKSAKSLFDEWIQRDGNQVTIGIAQHGDLKVVTDRSRKENSVAHRTAELIALGLKRHGLKAPTDVFYGNDFTLRLFLSVGLFNQVEWKILETHFSSKYAVVAQSIDQITDPEMRDAARKFFFVQQLSLYNGNIRLLSNLKYKLFAPETFAKIGITRIVQTKDSPTADPIDVITPKSIDATVFERLPKAIKGLVQEIMRNEQVILSTAYPLGHLTAMLSEALRQRFPTIDTIAFGGKLGMLSLGNPFDRVGQLMFPDTVVNQFGDDSLPVVNALTNEEVGASGFGFRTGTNMTTLALTAQSHREMQSAAVGLQDREALSLDVELYPFMEWVHALPVEIQAQLTILLGYYFSDKSIPPEFFDPQAHSGDKISERLGLRGSVPVFLSFYALLSRMAKKSDSKTSE